MPPDPLVDSQWVTLPPPHRRDPRERFIAAAAGLFELTRSTGSQTAPQQAVEKRFYNAMRSCPLPNNSLLGHTYKPKREDFYVHLVTCRLLGQELPYPVKYFAPL